VLSDVANAEQVHSNRAARAVVGDDETGERLDILVESP
jgi:hypothetical protein